MSILRICAHGAFARFSLPIHMRLRHGAHADSHTTTDLAPLDLSLLLISPQYLTAGLAIKTTPKCPQDSYTSPPGEAALIGLPIPLANTLNRAPGALAQESNLDNVAFSQSVQESNLNNVAFSLII